MTLLAGLLSITQGVLARVLVALGLSVLTITGVAVSVQAIKDQLLAGIRGAPLAWVQLAGLWGVWDGIGIVFGAVTFAVSFWALTSSVKLAGVGGS